MIEVLNINEWLISLNNEPKFKVINRSYHIEMVKRLCDGIHFRVSNNVIIQAGGLDIKCIITDFSEDLKNVALIAVHYDYTALTRDIDVLNHVFNALPDI